MHPRKRYTVACMVLLATIFIINYRTFFVSYKKRIIQNDDSVDSSHPTKTSKIDRSKLKNVLFIVSDDLRPQLNSYKGKFHPNPDSQLQMYTPNIDGLAKKSLLLTQAYVQYSVCGPSRSSYMTGRRPDTTQVWDLETYWRKSGGNFTTLPEYFKQHGYATAGVGKIYQPGTSSNDQDPPSWTIPYERIGDNYATKDSWNSIPKETREKGHLMLDEKVTQISKNRLRTFAEDAKSRKQPFFLAAGFYKPHMPLVCGEEFWDHYPLEKMDMPEYGYLPQGYPEAAYYASDEFVGRGDLKEYDFKGEMNETFPEDAVKMLRRAYFACVSFIDHQVGELLNELEVLGLADNTVVSFIGDHGFHLGENGLWGKHTNFHFATQTPMLIHIPGKTDRGVKSNSLVEFVDLYPTIVDAAGLGSIRQCPQDSSRIRVCTEGVSLMPLVKEPKKKLKDAVFSQLRMFKGIDGMHYSMRTEKYLFNEVVPFNRTQKSNGNYRYDILWEAAPGVELYDVERDPGERVNLVNNIHYLRPRAALSKQLHQAIESFATFENVKVLI